MPEKFEANMGCSEPMIEENFDQGMLYITVSQKTNW